MVAQRDVFWKAAVLTGIIFILGVLLGYSLEYYRISEIEREYKRIEIQWADAKLQSTYYQMMSPFSCNAAIKENLEFADRAYQEGLKLERYEKANVLKEDELFIDKQRYALLKLEFWMNSIFIKEKCNAKYDNLVYFYKDKAEKERIEQDTQSMILRKLKEKYGSRLMLIPLPINLDISTINIIKEAYNITKVPALLINEKIKLEGVYNEKEIEKYLENVV